jgi:HAD superfamily hydrolase (TIGR01459 family)
MTTVITALREIADRFDHVLLDQWGALHEGKGLFPEALACVAALHAAGKRVLVLTNSGRRAIENVRRLTGLGLPPESYDGAMSSGEVAWLGLRDRKAAPFTLVGRRCFLISRGNDRTVVDGTDLELTALEAADFILLSGLDDEATDLGAWRDRLGEPAARKVPMLCANPDLTMFGATGLIPAPGALAQIYEDLGGIVHYIGKPHRPIFTAALEVLGNPPGDRVLMIGDSLDHDIVGGRQAGILTLLIAQGVHREALAGATDIPVAVRRLAGSEERLPHWVIDRLVW